MRKKYLYKIWQDVNNNYDTYDSAIVCAHTEEEARCIDPSGFRVCKNGQWYFQSSDGSEFLDSHSSWASIEDVQVQQIGVANKDTELGVVVASFNAG